MGLKHNSARMKRPIVCGQALLHVKSVGRRDGFITRFSILLQLLRKCEALGGPCSCGSCARFEEAEVPSSRKAFGGEEVQVVLRSFNRGQIMLQTEVLRNKIASMHPDVARAVLLHSAMPVLLESSERRFANFLGRDEAARLGSA
jgi:hypothetical protein